MPETVRQRLESLRGQLQADRETFVQQWRDLGRFVLPTRPRFIQSGRGRDGQPNRGDRRNHEIINSTATFAARTLRSGMMGGLSNPARPWIRLTHSDPKLAELPGPKRWLYNVTKDMLSIFARSNVYNVLPMLYGDSSVFATACAVIQDDDRDVILGKTLPIGSYYLSANARGDVDTLVRDLAMTVRQLVGEFGYDRCSRAVRNMWDRGTYEQWVDVVHCTYPNRGDAEQTRKPWVSRYYEKGADGEDEFLRVGGLSDFPVLAPRWDVTGEDVYGTNCPGMEAIGDVKALQSYEKRVAQAVEKIVNPPMTGPSSLRSQSVTILPGDVTYVDVRDGQSGFRPAHEVRFSIAEAEGKIQQHEWRIRRAFFEDLFFLFTGDDKTHRTVPEIMAKEQEKLMVLGPVLERYNTDLFGPLVDITFNRMLRRGLVERPPPELEGEPIKVEYISVLAQAQKSVHTGSMERFVSFVGNMAGVVPDALDKLDFDEAVDEYADMTGVPPSVVRSDEEVVEIRTRKAQAQQAQQQLMAVQQAAQGAKLLSEADTSTPNLLTQLTGGGA